VFSKQPGEITYFSKGKQKREQKIELKSA